MNWDDVRYFLALARSGSVRAAGASLAVSHSTVARRVEALETQLGVRLFDRHRDGYLLTGAGKQMVVGAERIEQEMAGLERGVAGRDARLAGPVRVTCTDPFLARMLLRALAALCERHPGIEIELDNDSRYLDLSKREADVAVRAQPPGATPPEHLLGRKIAPIVIANYVAVAHQHRLDPDEEGTQPRWLGSDRRKMVASLIASSSFPDLPAWGAFTSLVVTVEAAHQGLGLVMLPTYIGDPDPALRRLARPDLRHVADLWLLSHPDLRDNARLIAARECVAEALKSRAALFEGDGPTKGWGKNAPVRPEDAPHTEGPSTVGLESG